MQGLRLGCEVRRWLAAFLAHKDAERSCSEWDPRYTPKSVLIALECGKPPAYCYFMSAWV